MVDKTIDTSFFTVRVPSKRHKLNSIGDKDNTMSSSDAKESEQPTYKKNKIYQQQKRNESSNMVRTPIIS